MADKKVSRHLFRHLDAVRAVLSCAPTGLITDFDGTISCLALTPEEARISSLCQLALDHLSKRLALVAVVSGRPVRELRRLVGLQGVEYVGTHGMERLVEGKVKVMSQVVPYTDRMKKLGGWLKAQLDLPGMVLEDKGYSLAIHYRQVSRPDTAREKILAALGTYSDREGLEITEGKMVVEVLPSLEVNKGHVVRMLVEEYRLKGAFVLGDDSTDAKGLQAVRQISQNSGLRGLSVGVVSDGTPPEVWESADLVLEGVGDVERFLSWLVKGSL